jgi:hypothetical protein
MLLLKLVEALLLSPPAFIEQHYVKVSSSRAIVHCFHSASLAHSTTRGRSALTLMFAAAFVWSMKADTGQ